MFMLCQLHKQTYMTFRLYLHPLFWVPFLSSGDDVEVDMEKNILISHTSGKEYQLKPLGDVSDGLDLYHLHSLS